jgi:hypothetical protein
MAHHHRFAIRVAAHLIVDLMEVGDPEAGSSAWL